MMRKVLCGIGVFAFAGAMFFAGRAWRGSVPPGEVDVMMCMHEPEAADDDGDWVSAYHAMVDEAREARVDRAEALAGMIGLIEGLYAGDEGFLAAFRESQAKWEAFVVAQGNMKFPPPPPDEDGEENYQAHYGSLFGMSAGGYDAEMVATRIAQLKIWADGIGEGDIGAGSVRRGYDDYHWDGEKWVSGQHD